ncbi:MAG: hypothetical protein JXR51_16020 [Bacteroidales bacterium]|nr:hypothetical protein [Bacteroidales bacterium]
MKQFRSALLLIFFAAFFIYSCEKPKVYTNTPVVTFKSISLYDSNDTLGNEEKKIVLTIFVEDGDGDIGLPEYDTIQAFKDLDNKNLFINLYQKIDGEFVKVDLPLPHNYRTPYLEPQGQELLLRADIEVTFGYTKIFFPYDTIKYDFYLYDRAFNKSNIGETPEIPVDTTGTFNL